MPNGQQTSEAKVFPGHMRLVAIGVILLMLALAANIAVNDNFGHGAGFDTFNAGASNAWQLFINMDLITGLILALGWIVWRNRGEPALQQIAWVLLVLWWGNIIVGLYVLHALVQSGGRGDAFFMGRRVLGEPQSHGKPLGSVLQIASLIGAIVAAGLMVRGLMEVNFSGLGAFGYVMAFGLVAFGLAVHALSRPARF